MKNAYLVVNRHGTVWDDSEVKVGINWYKHSKMLKYKGLTITLYLLRYRLDFTFVSDHYAYVKLITRNGRWGFDHHRLFPLPIPTRKSEEEV
jgi:hypothetical protein